MNTDHADTAAERSTIQPGVQVQPVDFTELFSLWERYRQEWEWSVPFATPPWLAAWWQTFGTGKQPLLLQVSLDGQPIGIAPLYRSGTRATMVGSRDLSDYDDFPASPAHRDLFCRAILEYLATIEINELVLEQVRPDSLILSHLLPLAFRLGYMTAHETVSTSMQMELPDDWESYLGILSAKQRHEARRKLRRATDSGRLEFRTGSGPEQLDSMLENFLHLFRISRPDKEGFMTRERERFFRRLTRQLGDNNMLRLQQLEAGGQTIAVVFGVSYQSSLFLYNNGFDPRYRSISPGVVSKLLSIRSAIEAGMRTYDFLGGGEDYKYRLGGSEIPLSRCVISFADSNRSSG